KRERETHWNWFESWFNQSPWVTTLVSTLMGPLIMMLLILTFGPCILNKLMTFIKGRKVELMVVRQQYLELNDEMPRTEQSRILNAARDA
ncbi:ENV1 protein, partial [Campylorhamphus procurvoides]|nr:ENV1 protein [Campylorhamphus procurvoides]